jgi:hypothetical protein
MQRDEFIKKLHPAITHINASDNMSEETLHAINQMVDKVSKMTYEQIKLLVRTKNPVLNKEQALEEMRKGWKLTHGYFTDDEWVTIENNLMVFEDGVKISVEEFFDIRKEGFDNGWTKWFPSASEKTEA